MKKKIKDLTKKETKQICDKHKNCHNCPFLIVGNPFVCKDDELDKYGNEEIEVEDDD